MVGICFDGVKQLGLTDRKRKGGGIQLLTVVSAAGCGFAL